MGNEFLYVPFVAKIQTQRGTRLLASDACESIYQVASSVINAAEPIFSYELKRRC
jgi:hypothetical protein